ncbi:MAG: ABC transporter ATP-binding protein [Chloroflexota bacterium]
MSRVHLNDVTKRYGQAVAVDRVSADIRDGEFVTLLGPSGCGKTTTLRMVAGLVEPTAGTIAFDDQVMNGVPPNRRNIGLAFQSQALFPHLSVARNVAFGLEVKGTPKAEVRERVEEMLDMVELGSFGDRMPGQLSGGQQQRVALARMLATNPRVLLFDEPLSALDRNLRDTLKYSILELQRRTRKTAIYVTHDQSEAFAISDRIFVMNKGRIEQAGTQLDIYLRPETEFVANFVGDNNALRGVVAETAAAADGSPVAVLESGALRIPAANPAGLAAGEAAMAFIRPEHVAVVPEDAPAGQPGEIAGRVEQIVFEGPMVKLLVDADGTPLRVALSGAERLGLLDAGSRKIRLRVEQASLVRDAG